jgi:arginyl-tRNA synthetase
VRRVLEDGPSFGCSTAGGKKKVLVEFVSANPTGPLHVGHGRGAAYGGSLCKLLAFAGWEVTSEYYVNDAGRQMDILAVVDLAALSGLAATEATPASHPFSGNAYKGAYVREMARQLLAAHGERYLRSAASVIAGTPGLPDPGAPTPKPRSSAKRISTP